VELEIDQAHDDGGGSAIRAVVLAMAPPAPSAMSPKQPKSPSGKLSSSLAVMLALNGMQANRYERMALTSSGSEEAHASITKGSSSPTDRSPPAISACSGSLRSMTSTE